jgi:hypothetical protein
MLHKHKDTVQVENPAEFLLREDGVFEVTAPWGEIFRVTCGRGVKMAFTQIGKEEGSTRQTAAWRIRRDPVEA